MSQSSSSLTCGTAAPSDLPPAIQSKISSTSYDNEVTETTTHTNSKSAIEADATSGTKTYAKTLYTKNLCYNMHLGILKKMERYLKLDT